jgi:hypothetical membrane protein
LTTLSLTLFILAIYFYPGGTVENPSNPGFDFLYNTMSDLGQKIAHNGEVNTLSRALCTSAMFAIGIVVTTYFTIAPSFFQKRKSTKWFSIIGTVLGLIQVVLYLTMALTPVDVNTIAHNRLIYSSPAFLYSAILLYTILHFLDKDYPKINRFSFLTMSIVAVLLTITVIIGSILGEPLFTLSRRAGHTVFNFIVVILYGLQPIGAYFIVKKNSIEKKAINNQRISIAIL